MFKCPTSELPIRPSGRPTANDEASSSANPVALLESSSMTGVFAFVMASPSLGESLEGIPQPSITTIHAQQHQYQPPHFHVDQDVGKCDEVLGAVLSTSSSSMLGTLLSTAAIVCGYSAVHGTQSGVLRRRLWAGCVRGGWRGRSRRDGQRTQACFVICLLRHFRNLVMLCRIQG